MKNLKKIIGAALALTLAGFTAVAQSRVDQGHSVHNYKHPNKAKKATYPKSTPVYTSNTVTAVSSVRANRHVSNTPKYAPKYATLTAGKPVLNETITVNPLLSQRNYKTQAVRKPLNAASGIASTLPESAEEIQVD